MALWRNLSHRAGYRGAEVHPIGPLPCPEVHNPAGAVGQPKLQDQRFAIVALRLHLLKFRIEAAGSLGHVAFGWSVTVILRKRKAAGLHAAERRVGYRALRLDFI